MHKVEVFYVLCLFLTGKHKSIVSWLNFYVSGFESITFSCLFLLFFERNTPITLHVFRILGTEKALRFETDSWHVCFV